MTCGLLLAVGCNEGQKEEEPPSEEPLGPPPPVSGTFHWYADITPSFPVAQGFAVAPDGRVALVASPIQAGTIAGVPYTHYGPGTATPNYDLLVAVLDASGKTAWWKTFATAEIESATSIAFDDKGDLYVTGVFKNNVDGLDFGNGVSVGIGPGEISSFLVKLRGTDGTALWAMAIQSDDRYVEPYCGFFLKERAVRGAHGAVGCMFDAGEGLGHVKLVTQAGATRVAPAGPKVNAFVLAFNPSTGEPTGTYVLGGVDSTIQALALTSSGGIVIGGQLQAGTVTDSAGSTPITLAARSCFVMSLSADLKPSFRRTFNGEASSDCEIIDVAVAGPDRILIGGNGLGNVDFGDGVASTDLFGFTGVLNANLSNSGAFERFSDESVFGVVSDAWGQSFVGLSKAGSTAPSFRYTKHGADGTVIYTSKTYTSDASASNPSLKVLGLATDKSGALSVFGRLSGPFLFDDGTHGQNSIQSFFALRFAP